VNRRGWHSCDPADLHRLAREWFMGARRIELQKLAVELGISRATAYRWVGSAEQLVGEVLASIVEDTLDQIALNTRSRGGDRVLEVLERGMHAAHGFEPLRQFLHRNPQLGLKLLTSRHGPVQQRTIGRIRALLEEEVAAGHMTLVVDPEVMAYALTRIVESFLYADLITGARPDLKSAAKILRLLLRSEAAGSAQESAGAQGDRHAQGG
jgi:AcrR family transcriptional regulator